MHIDAAQPWRGRSGIALAGLTTGTAAKVEGQLKREASANHGWVIPAPTAGLEPEASAALTADLRALTGRTAMVPGMQSFGDGQPGSHPGNWQPRRIGFSPDQAVVNLRAQSATAVLGAAGVPPAIVDQEADGGARREAWRQFLHGTIQPAADLVAEELSRLAGMTVTLRFDRLFASDVQGRARAFKSLRDGGLSLADAARATGIELTDAAEPTE